MLPKKCSLQLGDVFNFLTVIDYDKSKKKYICKCICGNETRAAIWNLKNGRNKSCGCKQEYYRAKRIAKTNFASLKNVIYKHYKYQAKRRNYNFELSKEQFLNIISKNCAYCGKEPDMSYGKYGSGTSETDYSEFKYNGIDRVDNTKGYTLDNSVACCKICNNSKSTLTKDAWLSWLKEVYEYNFNK